MRRPDREYVWFFLIFTVLLVIALTLLAVFAPRAYTAPPTVEASLNVHNPAPAWQIREDIRAAMERSSLIRLQEVQSRHSDDAVASVLRRHRWWSSTGRRSELAILWDRRRWQQVGSPHILGVLPQRDRVRPGRVIAWVALRHRATGQVVTIANIHADPHICWHGRGWYAAQGRIYFRAVALWTRQQQAAHPKRAILLGGDFNCWVPRPLRRLYRPEAPGRGGWGADHLLTSRGAAVTTVRRWHRGAHSDHDLELRTIRLG